MTCLMNECPTLVRTGLPPSSVTTSGTAFEQIRLCKIVAPGCCRSVAAASSAVVVEPLSPLPASSTTNTRSASPSKARPRSNPPATTRARRSRWLAGCSGSAGWFGNVPSSSAYMTSSSTRGSRSNTAGTTRPPMPLAVSATTLMVPMSAGSMKLTTWSANAVEEISFGTSARQMRRERGGHRRAHVRPRPARPRGRCRHRSAVHPPDTA